MIPNDLEERKKMISYMLATIAIEYDELSPWEQNFIDSINEQFQNKGTLSDRQCEKLEQIYDKF
jgi:hypothetical protein